MYKTVVAIDLETNGVDPYRDHIIEVGAAIYEDGQMTRTFSELAQCPVPLTPGIIKLTGITPDMLKDARPLDAVLADFLAFLPADTLCLAHNASFERSFLRRATKDIFSHTVLDTVGLARICFPTLQSHSLSFLADALEFDVPTSHRALADCETLLQLWARLLERSLEIPPAVVGEMNFLLAENNRHPYRDFFQRVEAAVLAKNFGRVQTIEQLFRQDVTMPPRRVFPDEDDLMSDIDEAAVADLFSESGAFADKLDNYEPRTGQADMAHAVVQAFNDEQHLLVEAGTGIGKSFAYLVPAVIWATTNNTPVVISTNTKNLQAQLYEKDIPAIRDILGVDFKAALIKGRSNYLCIKKLLYILRQANRELDSEERMRMLNILPWAVWTKTGDLSENIVGGRPGFYKLWAKLSSGGRECGDKACRPYRCFLHRARAKAMSADIVIANHSLVFAEINMKSPALPPYQHIVFDEAHNLEAAATTHLSIIIARPDFEVTLGRLYRPGRRKKENGTGLVPAIQSQLENSTTDFELGKSALEHVANIITAVSAVSIPLDLFFHHLESLLGAARDASNVRFRNDSRDAAVWEPIIAAKEQLFKSLATILHSIERLIDCLRKIMDAEEDAPSQGDFIRSLEWPLEWIRDTTEHIEFVLESSHENFVYFIERGMGKGKGNVRAVAAPIVVGPLLHDQLYARKKSIIFSSATLSVRNSFDFLKGRLGIDLVEPARIREMDAGTPFDYPNQCRTLVPSFLPEPGEQGRDYAQEFSVLMSEVFRRTRGRALSLFTSYDMLRKTAKVLETEMQGDGIRILAQGLSGSRESITSIFKRDVHSVLLGTHSFWEGVDIAGETLSCLTIARLPFAVFTDPVHQARCEQVEAAGGNAFMGYSLPNAVIRFRQGFGRLIRHKTDRGIVIIADRRIVAKRYGQWFRESLPVESERFNDREAFLDAVETFFDTDTENHAP